ncbi:heterokaryon incompatibility 6 OR allele [Fusarium beomiforme]|uniref:Heterokaryon incompatibility 6 OR allele n=1 Tax=Fusarium beomiforme TaxID=44412 RepID=A0A9P5A881_9HYPO|nr:heterokaryon incompatibility 6 OR allele [Fusarium beomiforme]
MRLNKDFTYLPLTLPTQTRIILLAPGKREDPIHCSQFIIDLDHDWRSLDEVSRLKPCSTGESASSQEPILNEPQSGSAIRGLQIQPGSGSSCHTLKGYTALSYVWGDQSNPHEIFIDSKSFYVGENLYTALLRLRQPIAVLGLDGTALKDFDEQRIDAIQHLLSSEGRLLWVDAICINQNDIAERVAQVKLMARIYQQAEHVHGDLGQKDMTGGFQLLHLLKSIIKAGSRCESQMLPSDEFSQHELRNNPGTKIDLMPALFSEFQTYKAGSINDKKTVPNPSAKILEEQGIPGKDDEIWAHWRQLLNSTYFQRLWIVQEACLASSVTLWYSNVSIELDTIAKCLEYLVKYSINLNIYSISRDEYASASRTSPNIWAVTMLIQQRRQMHDDNGNLIKQVPLLDMIDAVRRTKATDARDKIYGLLGMAADGSDFLHLVSYSRSVEAVYQDFAEVFIKRGQGISMLYQVDSRMSKSLDIPSWVPDWSRDRDETSLNDTIPRSPDASGEESTLEISYTGSKLAIKGHIVDTVERLGTPISSNSTYTTFSELAAFLWTGGNLLVQQNIQGDQAVEIMLQTLSCGSLSTKLAAEVESLRQGFTAVFGHGTFMINGGRSEDSPWLPHMRYFKANGMALTPGRRWCITKTGKFGLVPGGTKEGDRVALFGAESLPFLLRGHLTHDKASGQCVGKSDQQSVKADLCLEASMNTKSAYTLQQRSETDCACVEQELNHIEMSILNSFLEGCNSTAERW